ncbi:MAG: hypothetical protein CL963_00885 [Euryarchaeota archaeon]|jgi:endonuclease/exonuclease/phosphatase family metal-dependent hydrolase|nr:hypothetical protein [Euryarchaeota archaeon]HIK01327.1 endonuclease/exonuclease/phosphatase family protein [Candidatus Undinarchaeales archaeon ERR594346 U_76725]|tara:strand:- start:373 stop:1164 length:792 start_codon:yes stop_codon:yes gene_type:complete
MKLKILSWNVWVGNRKAQEVVDFIFSQKADIICLQEVPSDIFELLQTSSLQENYYFYQAVDHLEVKKHGTASHLVTMFKKDFRRGRSNTFELGEGGIRRIYQRIMKWHESVEGSFVDIERRRRKYRIFNVHLEAVAPPRNREKQFKKMLKQREPIGVNIVCGDFNIIGGGKIKNFFLAPLFTVIYGFRGRDLVKNEKKEFKEVCRKYGLKDPFLGKKTYAALGHTKSLDKILIPDSFEVLEKEVIKKLYGSDHYPIILEVKEK